MSDRIGFPHRYFERLYGRAPTPSDRARLLCLKNLLDLSDNDELWPLLMTLEHFNQPVEKLAKIVPDLIMELQEFRTAESKKPDSVGDLSVADFRRLLEEAQSRSAAEMRGKKDRWRLLQITTFTIAGALLGAIAAYVYVFQEVGLCSSPPRLLDDGVVYCLVDVAGG